MLRIVPFLVLLAMSPAWAASLEHEETLNPTPDYVAHTPAPTATAPVPTPDPECVNGVNPTDVTKSCTLKLSPFQQMAQRVQSLEQANQQIVPAFNQMRAELNALKGGETAKKK